MADCDGTQIPQVLSAEDRLATAARLYTPIKAWQTRIIRLHPGAYDEPLQADLLVAGLAHGDGLVIGMDQELISYEAISYAWGAPSYTEPISINGLQYSMTYSLACALHRFRHLDQNRYLWADALCIDQGNTEEKSRQVLNMFTIYQKAERVLVWLGPEVPETATAIDALGSQYAMMKSTSPRYLDIEGKSGNEGGLLRNLPHKSGVSDEAFAGLADLCSRPWARRVWCVNSDLCDDCDSY